MQILGKIYRKKQILFCVLYMGLRGRTPIRRHSVYEQCLCLVVREKNHRDIKISSQTFQTDKNILKHV